MYKYETHLHTAPVSKCAKASARETLEFYKEQGYDGVFITNHFLDGNINIDRSESYENKINFYFSDYEDGVEIGREIGLKVFMGIETSYGGTDFLIYGLGKEWFLANPQVMDMPMKKKLELMAENGAFVVQAHPFRERDYIDHIRLFPRSVHAVEVINTSNSDFSNEMSKLYADMYQLPQVAGSDNHTGGNMKRLAGVETEEPINCEADYARMVKDGTAKIFTWERED
ncbi:MAG: histidinol phosphatase [Clostridia bacterium]|nr:histidinol phosphatase [Clostridia bacterium]